MNAIWLIWSGQDTYCWMRRELKARYGAARFLRLGGVSCVPDVLDGFGDVQLCAAVWAGSALGGLDQAERIVGDLARSGRVDVIIVCMDEAHAGGAARCFHAGATEVIAAGGADASECTHRPARTEEETVPEVVRGAALDDAPACDDACGYDEGWEEVPPWDESLPNRDSGQAQPAAIVTHCAHITGAARDSVVVDGAGAVHRAPVVTVISGRGGSGKTTLVAAMATCAARAGLRAAVLDLDLMFGDLSTLLGVTSFRGIEGVGLHADERGLAERDVEGAAMRVGPGLTLWGPCDAPEHAELCSGSIERLVDVLRVAADVIFIDTSGHWGDAVAMAVASCDRCLVVGCSGSSAASSGRRAVELAARLGVPHTRMTCVFNRMGAHGSGEEAAVAFEMGTALRSRARIVDGGDEVSGLLAVGQVQGLIAGASAYAKSVRTFTSSLLKELGCPIAQWLLDEEQRRAAQEVAPRFRLPWRRRLSDAL